MSAVAEQYDVLMEIISGISEEEKLAIDQVLREELNPWTPLEGPQLQAYESEADVLFFGGAAGGSKTDLLIGLALTQHRRSIIFRREATQLPAIIDRLTEILGSRNGYNSQSHIWRVPGGRQIEFGSTPFAGDESRYQGRPHDGLFFDEISNFLESQFRFLCGWNRTTMIGQRCRIVCAGNPPTSAEGEWVIRYWRDWLDPNCVNPAKPGELRWYAMVDGVETPRDNKASFVHKGKVIRPQSRTFIPSKVTDNPFLMETGYEATLQSLPEPLRSQMLDGSFVAGKEDGIWQLIPTSWVDEAMARWHENGRFGKKMSSVGVDVARGGRDQTVVSTRYDWYFDKLKVYPGLSTPDGAIVAGLVVALAKDAAPCHIDTIGVGSSVVDHLNGNGVHTVAINGAATADEGARDKATGKLKFRNKRAQCYWRLRELLEPRNGHNVSLPLDMGLKADLCSLHWKLTSSGILVESKDELKKRLGRSPDLGDAVVLCAIDTDKRTSSYLGREWRKKLSHGSWRSI